MYDQENWRLYFITFPVSDHEKDWTSYWTERGQPWCTEPEINAERQKYLEERRYWKYGKKSPE